MKRTLILLIVGLLAVAVSACGGGGETTPEEYAEAVVTARDRTDYALGRIVVAGSEEELIDRMLEARDLINDAAGDLEDVDVPSDYQPEGTRLVRQLSQLAFDVGATGEQLEQPGFEDVFDHTRGLSFASWDNVNRNLAALAGKGIPVVILQHKRAQPQP